jgi:hypothetical protein
MIPHRTAPHRTAPHRTAPHRTAPHRQHWTTKSVDAKPTTNFAYSIQIPSTMKEAPLPVKQTHLEDTT